MSFSVYRHQRLPRLLKILMLATTLATGSAPIAFAAKSSGSAVKKTQIGTASYYGPKFHGRKTASGRLFDQNELVAAHPSLPFGTVARVTNLENGRTVKIHVVDRGPAKRIQRRGVIIDLSTEAARKLGFIKNGKAKVRIDVLRRGL